MVRRQIPTPSILIPTPRQMIPRIPALLHSARFIVVPRLLGPPRILPSQRINSLVTVRNVLAASCAVSLLALQGSALFFEVIATPSHTLRYQPPLGFGGNDQTPAVPPNTAFPNSPTNGNTPFNRGNSPPRKPVRRAPSPMGERILKGHFDGFN